MRPALIRLSGIAVALASLGACSASDPVDRGPRTQIDAGTTAALPAPEVEVVPRTPDNTVAVRGTTEGTRIVISNDATDPVVASVLPGGSYCKDVNLVANEPNALSVYALGGDGRVSAAANVEVVHDPEATRPADATCSGGSSDCLEEEICDSGRDDNCNGKVDFCDLSCSGCVPDSFSPNHEPVNVPKLQPGSYDLRICPCHDDWFAFSVAAGDTIHVVAEFVHDDIDLDLSLHPAGPEGNGAGPAVDESTTNTNREEIEYLVEQAGLYYLRAFAFPESAQGSGDYTLTIF